MSEPTRRSLPLILIRGFGGLDVSDEKKDTYQRFNVGTVYPQKQGENYIYEGLILRFIKSNWNYQDATNVVGYYGKPYSYEPLMPEKLKRSTDKDIVEKFMRLKDLGYFSGSKVIIDPGMALHLLETMNDPLHTLWVFRYYDLDDRKFNIYGEALVRLIDFIRELTAQKESIKTKVNIIAHSMGGLIVREAIQRTYPRIKNSDKAAAEYINKVVTLGTPHQGISFQIIKNWINISAEEEIEHFNPEFQKNRAKNEAFVNFHKYFPLERLLTVVGTNYRTYDSAIASKLNRLFPMAGEYGSNYNRSDGLVKQTAAQIPGAPRTFVHKCHGGDDSLITSREAFEVATRFFFGNVRSRLRFVKGKVTRGKDFFGKSEFFLGVSIKPRRVDFDLFHQSKEAENCYGPFSEVDPQDKNIDFREENQKLGFPWADSNKLIWEGYLDTTPIIKDKSITTKDMVMRLDFYVGERDLFGIGFSDNVIFRQQYYIRALLPTEEKPYGTLYLHTDERFSADDKPMEKKDGGWEFEIGGSGFQGTFRIEIDDVPEDGQPMPFGQLTEARL
ncbi:MULTISPECIES: esterase/lipase family protein [Cyanophyceae]|uniref:esterase/lipase family protein n=1 Tax=Cyanophyceae TaxID=3028117 RepID=UPI0016860F4D|nr:alpha/beta hydrolase [Trichocoleus sp. FACHB-69]MBD1935378.1 alpha/beta hydrolase [Trichocoleus sp. FACHB-69]